MLLNILKNQRVQLLDTLYTKPFPQADKRDFWDSLPVGLAENCIRAAEMASDADFAFLTASSYMEYRQNGNRVNYETAYFHRRRILTDMVTGECIEYQGRYISSIIDMIWMICEESTWVVPAHNSVSSYFSPELPDTDEPIVSLFSAETGALLTWAFYLLMKELDEVSPLLKLRIKREIERRLITPFLGRDDFFWMGLVPGKGPVNNWNPWINSNMLVIAALLVTDPEKRGKIVEKICLTLDNFLARYGEDGGCDEDAAYWDHAGGNLFNCLELLHTLTSGAISIYNHPLIGNIGSFLYKMNIQGPWFVNFADGCAKTEIDSALVYLFGKRIGDKRLEALGIEAFKRQGPEGRDCDLPESFLRRLRRFAVMEEMSGVCRKPDVFSSLDLRDVWLSDLQAGVARENGKSVNGLLLAFKGGHNNESHNHNDIGSFVIYLNGKPVLIDVGVETYTKKTFSDERYSIWTMQSLYHNLPEINGTGQAFGFEFRAGDVLHSSGSDASSVSMDISAAYPENARIDFWLRSLTLERGDDACVKLEEKYHFKNDTNEIALHFMTPWKPEKRGMGKIRLFTGDRSTDALDMYYPAELEAILKNITVTDTKLRRTWPEEIYRISLKCHSSAREGNLRIKFKTVH